LLRRTAIAGGTLAWVVPSIQVVSMSRAVADTPSGTPADHENPHGGTHGTSGNSGHGSHAGPGTGGGGSPIGGGNGVGGKVTSTHLTGTSSSGAAEGALTTGVPQSVPLASTGAAGLTSVAGVVGGALTVAGAASVIAARRRAVPVAASDSPDAQTDHSS
jgi:hypothetical protein